MSATTRPMPPSQIRRIQAFSRGQQWQVTTYAEPTGRVEATHHATREDWETRRAQCRQLIEETSGRFNANGEWVERPFFKP